MPTRACLQVSAGEWFSPPAHRPQLPPGAVGISGGEDWNLITRTIMPIVSQPQLVSGQDRETGLGDTTFTAFLSPAKPSRVIWGVGPVFLIPTASDDRPPRQVRGPVAPSRSNSRS